MYTGPMLKISNKPFASLLVLHVEFPQHLSL